MGVMKIVTGKLGESYIYIYTDEGDMKSESSSRGYRLTVLKKAFTIFPEYRVG